VRLVLDTNTVISGLLWKGPPHTLLTAAREDPNILLHSSPRLLAELADVLGRRKFGAAVSAGRVSPDALLQRYLSVVNTVVPAPIAPVVIADPDDDHVLACAVAAAADLIVSGDSDLLGLKAYQGIPIVTAAEALTRLPRRP
jgi:putative PIN family toxin of toxin-antitoxin system